MTNTGAKQGSSASGGYAGGPCSVISGQTFSGQHAGGPASQSQHQNVPNQHSSIGSRGSSGQGQQTGMNATSQGGGKGGPGT